MVCNVIEECRCYAYDDVKNPKREQFCGVRKGPHIIPCPKDCCAGGCPGKFPREPFRIVKRPILSKPIRQIEHLDIKILIFLTVVLAGIFMLLL